MSTIPRAILDNTTARILATNAGLRVASYREPIERQPEGGTHRRFQVAITGGRISRQMFGNGETPILFDLSVKVYYARPGGNAGGGDRRQINEQATDDATLIADALTDLRSFDLQNTAIRERTYVQGGTSKIVDEKKFEVWESRFKVEAMYSWPT